MSKKMRMRIWQLWKRGRNVWEISQIVGVSEAQVWEVVGG